MYQKVKGRRREEKMVAIFGMVDLGRSWNFVRKVFEVRRE
jgi:hypothetical protein